MTLVWYLTRFVYATCLKVVITHSSLQTMELTELFSNLTTIEQIDKTDNIIMTLSNITVPTEQSQYPQDLSTTVDIISSINK